MTQTISNFLQWLCIFISLAASFASVIIYFFRPRLIRRLFQAKVKFVGSVRDNQAVIVTGYVVQWLLQTKHFVELPIPLPDKTVKKLNLKELVQEKKFKSLDYSLSVVVECRDDSGKGYQHKVFPVEQVEFQ